MILKIKVTLWLQLRQLLQVHWRIGRRGWVLQMGKEPEEALYPLSCSDSSWKFRSKELLCSLHVWPCLIFRVSCLLHQSLTFIWWITSIMYWINMTKFIFYPQYPCLVTASARLRPQDHISRFCRYLLMSSAYCSSPLRQQCASKIILSGKWRGKNPSSCVCSRWRPWLKWPGSMTQGK